MKFKTFVHRLVEVEKAVVEGAGACGLAALLAGLLPELKGSSMNTLLDRCIINLPCLTYYSNVDRSHFGSLVSKPLFRRSQRFIKLFIRILNHFRVN